MKVILLKAVHNLGQKGAIMEVSDGYAKNFLLPKGWAVPAESKLAQNVKSQIAHQEKTVSRKKQENDHLLNLLRSRVLEFQAPATEQGHLYAGISAEDIAKKISEALGTEPINPKNISIDKPIKTVGRHQVGYHFANNQITINISVSKQG